MKKEDCKINVRCFIPRRRVDKREILNHPDINFVNGKAPCVVSRVYSGETCKIRYLNTLEVQEVKIKYLELLNKFEVGDEVIYNCSNGIKYDSVIFGIKDRQYAIKYTHKTIEHYDVVKESQLSPLKKKDELEAGDKFRNKFYEFRIIFVAYDDFYNKKKYICKINDTGSKGLIQTMFPEDIKEIIYE
jgi:hypothetical protein